MLKKISIILILCASLFPADAEQVKFLLNATPSGANANSSSAEIPVEFDEKWFSQNSAFEYSHSIARIACILADSSYTDVLSNPDGNFLRENYRRLGVKDSDMEFHYDVDYSNSIWGNDQCACSFAIREIKDAGGKKKNLVFAVLRGTPFNSNEWLSNLNINDSGATQNEIHKGFALAASVAHTQLISFMLRHKIDPTESCILITGHSRGAATANVLSMLLLEDNFFRQGTIYTYTFAAPNTTTDKNAHDDKYGFIWNIVNPEDIVPTVPLYRGQWHFTKYGHTRALVSAASEGSQVFNSEYMPKINSIYEKISGREYAPFTTGPLVPVLITKLLESLASDVEKYYSGFLSLHSKFSSAMRKAFPDKENAEGDDVPDETKEGGGVSWFFAWINRRTGGKVDYIKLAFNDMHTNDIYLSFMLSFGEDKVFSTKNYSTVIVKGTEEIAVFDTQGSVLGRVIDGKIRYSDTKLPVMIVPLGRKNVLIASPVSESYKVCVTDETLIPTPASVKVEYFDAAGVYIETSEKTYLFPRTGRVYEFEAGEARINEFMQGTLEVERVKMKKEDARNAVKKASLKPQLVFNITPELYTDTNWTLGGGIHFGCPAVFGSAMTSFGLTRFGKAAELTGGIGSQLSIFANIKLENEVFARCLWLEQNDDGDDLFNLVPSFRSSLSLKMIGRLTLFTAGVFDFKIDGFNGEAFDSAVRNRTISTFRISDKLRVAPSIQFGARF